MTPHGEETSEAAVLRTRARTSFAVSEPDPRRSALAKAIVVVTVAVVLAAFAGIVALLAHARILPA